MNAYASSDAGFMIDESRIKGPSIELDQLSLSFGEHQLFQPVSMTLAAGKLHMLTGANGAGKSSLLKCMAGLMPHQGDIFWHWPVGLERDLREAQQESQKVAYIPQLEAFDATLPITVEDYLLASIQPKVFFRRPADKEQQRLALLLSTVGLDQKRRRKIGQLSGGERQRLLFARALAQGASLWFLDEPMNGLDQKAQQQILQLILQLKADGCTLVMVHHDPAFVEAYADHEVRVVDGRVVEGAVLD
ncbi:metal ABC transporter ATP-binding protein, partial [Oceanospirillum sp. HFRX-1_2]